MHNARITECPHCNTAFRVSDAQLRAAKGAVRCGSCLEVFLAHQHWLSEEDHNDNSAELELDEWGDDPNAIFAELEQLDRDLESTLDDESWALKLLEEEGEVFSAEINDSLLRSETNKTVENTKISEPAFIVLNDEDTSSEEIVNDDIVDNIEEQIKSREPDIDQEDLTLQVDKNPDAGIYHDDAYDPLADETLAGEPRIDNTFDWDDLDNSDNLAKTVAIKPRSQKTSARVISYLIILLGLIGFGAQYSFFHFDELSQNAQWRPTLQMACEQIGCTIPPWKQFNAIQHDDLVVRSHPQQPDALLINVRIINASPYPQAFPILDMRFSDINGNIIGSRRFKPEEYLAGELSGLKLMPAQQPVQVELGIVDPGKDAVNYQLQLIEKR